MESVSDHSMTLSDTKNLLEDVLGVKSTSFDDRRIVKHVCELVGTRSARLSAAAVVCQMVVMNWMVVDMSIKRRLHL
jgi:hexokinase